MSETRILRIGQEVVSDLLIVVKCGKIYKIRFRVAMALMRLAGRIGGFKSVKVVRDKS